MTSAIKNKHTWLRIVFVALFAIIFFIVKYLVCVVSLLQVVFSLFSITPNHQLQKFGGGLAEYAHQIIRYLTYNTTTRPFPFKDWPTGVPADTNASLQPAIVAGTKATQATKAKAGTTSAKSAAATAKSATTKTTKSRKKPIKKAVAKPVTIAKDTQE